MRKNVILIPHKELSKRYDTVNDCWQKVLLPTSIKWNAKTRLRVKLWILYYFVWPEGNLKKSANMLIKYTQIVERNVWIVTKFVLKIVCSYYVI